MMIILIMIIMIILIMIIIILIIMATMIMMIKITLIIAVVIINSPFQPGDFPTKSTADYVKYCKNSERKFTLKKIIKKNE